MFIMYNFIRIWKLVWIRKHKCFYLIQSDTTLCLFYYYRMEFVYLLWFGTRTFLNVPSKYLRLLKCVVSACFSRIRDDAEFVFWLDFRVQRRFLNILSALLSRGLTKYLYYCWKYFFDHVTCHFYTYFDDFYLRSNHHLPIIWKCWTCNFERLVP